MIKKHELTDTYEHHIKWNKERFKKYIGLGCLVALAALFFLYVSSNSQGGDQEFFSSIFAFLGGTFSLGFFWTGLSYLKEVRRLEKLKKTALSYPAYVGVSVTRAHINVSPWLTNPSQVELKPALYGKLCARYCELEKLSTEELRQKLEDGGVWNPNNGWFEKGRTLNEGLMMAIYTRRTDKETAQIEATKATHTLVSHAAEMAADLQVRKVAEQQKQALAEELEELGQEPERFIDWELDDLEGNARMHLRGDEVIRVTFALPRGVYKVTVTDSEAGKKTQKLLRMNEGEGVLDLVPPIRGGQIFITSENGKAEIISLD